MISKKQNENTGQSYEIEIQSKPKPRPRVTSRGVYYDPNYKKYEEQLIKLLKAKRINFDFTKPFSVHISLSKDKITLWLREWSPMFRKSIDGDIDNHAKAVLDALARAYDFNDNMCCSLYVSALELVPTTKKEVK